MDRLDAMQVLLAVVDEGSLSAGSRKLKAPLPSVSRKVAELERHLGTRLLIRTSRNIQLTDAGRDYVEAVRQIVAQLKDAELRASGEYEIPRGQLTLTVPMQLGQRVVVPLAYRFLDEHPEITLNILSLDRLVSFVDEHVDVGVRLGNLADSSLYALKVGEVRLVTCASPEYLKRCGRPQTPRDLPEHEAAIFGQLNESAWTYSCDGARIEGLPRIRARTNTAEAAVTAALQGVGVTRVLNFMVAGHVQEGRLVPILNDYDGGSLPVHLVYVRQGLLPLKVRAFLDWMTPHLRKRLKELDDACCR